LPLAPFALSLRDLSFTYPDGQVALAGVSLEVAAGDAVGLIGPNGAGKSTLLLHLNGILRGSGTVEVCGLPLNDRNLREIRRLVGLVFEDPNDQLFMPTVFDDVAFGALNLGLSEAEGRARTEAALRAVGMLEVAGRPPHHLSLGQRKRVALATVLVMDCRLLALDDPTGGLDPAGREDFLALLASLPQTKLIASHDLEMVWEMCSRVALMDGGQVVTVGETREVLSEEALLREHGLRLPPQARR
jgi:cobalt/nickel transport system ATP-binding protein